MPDFKPADNYHALLRQAMALNDMVKVMESELSLLRRQVNPDLLADLEQQVDSERAANARLTEELENRAVPLNAKPNPDCRDMVAAYLRQNGFDGLFCEECGCSLDDLMPCGGDWAIRCVAGYKQPGCADDCGQGCDFHIVREKPLPAHAGEGVIYARIDGADKCECHRCTRERFERGEYQRCENESHAEYIFRLPPTKMILCPECGNKRCPHASDHRLACTGSNEPGQPGSVY